MFGDILYRLGQLLLALIIVGFVLYKLALTLDLVPEGFSPSGFISSEYKKFKEHLSMDAEYPNAIGTTSKILLRIITKIEDKVQQHNAPPTAADQECQASSFKRYFMGDDPQGDARCKAAKDAANKPAGSEQSPAAVGAGAPQKIIVTPEQLKQINDELKQIEQQNGVNPPPQLAPQQPAAQ